MTERGSNFLRVIDRGLGIPALGLFGLFHKRQKPPAEIRRIGLLKTAAIGDTVLISAIALDLRDAFPHAEIVFFAGASNREAAEMLLEGCRVVPIPVKSPAKAIGLIRAEGPFDVWIDFGQWPRMDAILSALAGAYFTIGFKTPGQSRHFAYDAPVLHSALTHEMENYRRLLSPLGIKGSRVPRFDLTDVKMIADRVVVHAFAGGTKAYLKEWPDDYWKQVIDPLTRRGYEIFLTGTAGNRAAAEILYGKLERKERVKMAVGDRDLRQTAVLLKSARLVISVNTGILHLAAALGCPIVALNGPTSGKRWGPLSPAAASIQSPRACSPCLNLGFDYKCPVNDCMKEISPQAVIDHVDRLLA